MRSLIAFSAVMGVRSGGVDSKIIGEVDWVVCWLTRCGWGGEGEGKDNWDFSSGTWVDTLKLHI